LEAEIRNLSLGNQAASKLQDELHTVQALLKRKSDEVNQLQLETRTLRDSQTRAEAEVQKHRMLANSAVQAKQDMASVSYDTVGLPC
jgi:regulator of replication initiation timing